MPTSRVRCVASLIERAHPVRPVPDATISPLDDWSSARAPSSIR